MARVAVAAAATAALAAVATGAPVSVAGAVAAWSEDLGPVDILTRPRPVEDICGGFDHKASPSWGKRARANASAGEPAWETEYSWCTRAIRDNDSHELLGLSFGVLSWDNWSKRMSNVYEVPSMLFDCYTKADPATAPALQGYDHPFKFYRICLGPTGWEEPGREFAPISRWLEGRSPLSVLLKIDVEGSEWAVFKEMTDEDFAKIRTLDIEIHFSDRQGKCKGPHHDPKIRITKMLAKVRKHFVPLGREPSTWNKAGCRKTQGDLTMMSVSYLNKAYITRLRELQAAESNATVAVTTSLGP